MKIHKLHCGNFRYKRCLCGYHRRCGQKFRVQTEPLNVMEQLINNKLHWHVYIWWFSNSQRSLWHHHAELRWLFYHFGLEESKTLWWLQDQRILHRQTRCWLPGVEGGQPGGCHREDLHCELQPSKMIHVLTKLPVLDIKRYKMIQITSLQTSDNHLIQCWCSQVDSLIEGTFYEFKVQAANMAGVGLPSVPSLPMKCVAWTMEEPGNRTLIVPATFSYRNCRLLGPGVNVFSCLISRSSLRSELQRGPKPLPGLSLEGSSLLWNERSHRILCGHGQEGLIRVWDSQPGACEPPVPAGETLTTISRWCL